GCNQLRSDFADFCLVDPIINTERAEHIGRAPDRVGLDRPTLIGSEEFETLNLRGGEHVDGEGGGFGAEVRCAAACGRRRIGFLLEWIAAVARAYAWRAHIAKIRDAS